MKRRSITMITIGYCVLGCIAISTILATNVLAAESGGGFTRADWDLIMRWVNFIILAAVIIKYASQPLSDFLKGRKEEVARTLERYETRKNEAEAKISESRQLLEASEERLTQIKERIVSEGERRKSEMIASAQQESRIMLETAQHKIESQIRETYGRIKGELIDAATEHALAKIPAALTTDDHDNFVRLWMEAAART